MSEIAVIGGSGFYSFPELDTCECQNVDTPYGVVTGLRCAKVEEKTVYFLPRHGQAHKIPPHKINYRANIAALAGLGVRHILAFNVTGGINTRYSPGKLVIPDQVIDYTYGREHTFFDGFETGISHIEFAQPFESALADVLHHVLNKNNVEHEQGATYGCVQGPRLETIAEIKRMQRDGCDLVGMTLMPEAALAKEKDMAYVSLCLVVNWAAGIGKQNIHVEEILSRLNYSMPKIRELILKTLSHI